MSLRRYQRGVRNLGGFAGGTSHLARPPAVLEEPDIRPSRLDRYFSIQGDYADNPYLAATMPAFQSTIWDLSSVDDQNPEGGPYLEFDPMVSTTRIAVLEDITVLATAAGVDGFPFTYAQDQWQILGGGNPAFSAGTFTLELRFLDASLAVIEAFSESEDLQDWFAWIVDPTYEFDVPAGGWIEVRISFAGAVPATDLMVNTTFEMWYRA